MTPPPPAKAEEGLHFYSPPTRHLLHSSQVNQTFQIDVMLPIRRRGDQRRYPVVYATDGNSNFDALKGISHSLQKNGTDAAPFILVGIGYPGDSPRTGRFLRRRDLTFPGYPRLGVLRPEMAQEGEIAIESGAPDLHGADTFLDFLERDLFPFIEREFPARRDRTLFGHSGGAMFGLYALFTRERLFTRYILCSPCIAYRGIDASGALIHSEFLAPYLEAYLTSLPLLEKELFLAVGGLEEEEAPDWQLVTNLSRLVARLDAARRPGLRIVHEVIADETHMSVWPIAFIRGVKAVLAS